MPNGVEFEGRLAHVGTFPIGIDPSSFIDNLKKEFNATTAAIQGSGWGWVVSIVSSLHPSKMRVYTSLRAFSSGALEFPMRYTKHQAPGSRQCLLIPYSSC